MGWILREFECECGNAWEELVDREDQRDSCAECGVDNRPVLSAPGIATYSIMSKDDQAKCLRKRSREHTLKELKKDPTQIRKTRRMKL